MKKGYWSQTGDSLSRFAFCKKLLRMLMAVVAIEGGTAFAIPAYPHPISTVQPDGTEIVIRKYGDENSHHVEDADGYTILRDKSTKSWVYAELDERGDLVQSARKVGMSDPTQHPTPRHIMRRNDAVMSKVARKKSDASMHKAAQTKGTVKNLVLLVEFKDKTFTYSKSDFNKVFNETGYSVGNAVGSVKDYYKEVSYGQLNMESVIAGPVRLSNGYAYYGANDSAGDDIRPREMIVEALDLLSQSGFDFSQVDGDGDGWVDGFDVIHAGYDEAAYSDEDCIWSHNWAIPSTKTYGGVSFFTYHTEAELYVRNGSVGITAIGVPCHETGHFLGLPDLYDTDYSSSGAGRFCLMSSGSWCGNGQRPAHMSAWCKVKLGWVSPTVISQEGTYSLPRVEDNKKIYKIQGGFPSTQYFLLENRQGYGFDGAIPGSTRGMLIWHIDDSMSDNTNENHYWVDLEEASGTQHLPTVKGVEGDDSDYFRSGNMSSFTAQTSPNTSGYSGQALGLDIVNISASGNTMSFSVQGKSSSRPANDNFANATRISGSSGSTSGSTVGATYQSGEPLVSFSASATNTVWWAWTAPASGSVTFQTTNTTFDTVMGIYTGSSVSSLTTVTQNDDGGPNRTSICTFSATGGTTYYIAVSGYGNSNQGTVRLGWAQQATPTSVTLSTAVDNSTLTFTTGGSSSWYGQTAHTHDGVDAARSGELGNSQTNWMQTTVSGPGTISFWWYVSSEAGYDKLEFLVDGVSKDNTISGTNNVWTSKSVAITGSGSHVLRWHYRKDGSLSRGLDAGFVDQITWIPSSVRPANDNFANATWLSGSSGSASGSTVGATYQSGEPLISFSPYATNTVWWAWTAPASGSVTFQTTNTTFDTVMGIYTGSSVSSLTTVTQNDDGGPNRTSICTFSATGGTTYYIAVSGYGNSNQGTVRLGWAQQATPTYSVILYRNTGEGTTLKSYIVPKGSWTIPTISSLSWSRSDYDFVGWGLSSTATSASYSDGQSISISGATTLYAVWREKALTLSAAVDNSTLTFTTGGLVSTWYGQTAQTHDGVDAARSGALGNNQTNWLQTTVSGPGTISFWWCVSSESGYDTLEFLVDGVSKDAISGKDNPWKSKSVTITGSGSHVLRWRYGKDSSVSVGMDSGFVDQITWTPGGDSYKVTLGKNGGTGGDSYVTATYGAAMPTPRSAPKKSGWTFDGYWDTLKAGGKQYYDKDMKSVRNWDKKAATTLWAKWSNKVTLGKNGGTGGDDYVTATEGQPMPTPRRYPDKKGWVFDGYWDTVKEGGKQYYNSEMKSMRNWDMKGSVTLWAKWHEAAPPMRVTFGKNEGTGGDDYVTVTEGQPMPTPRKAPTKSGWTFDGYWDSVKADVNGSPLGKQYYDKDMKSVRKWDRRGAVTLWAKWTVKVTLGKNGGTGGDNYVTATYGQPFPKRTMPTKPGYDFGGYWMSASKREGQCYNANGTGTASMVWKTGGSPTIWALWTAKGKSAKLYAPSRQAGTGAASPAAAPCPAPAPDIYVGTLADGTGEFTLEVGDGWAFVVVATERDAPVAAECEVIDDSDGEIVVVTEDGAVYRLVQDGE